MIKICTICGQFYYAEEKVCRKCKNENLKSVKNMEITCGLNKFKIIGDY